MMNGALEYLRTFILLIITPECYDKFFLEYNILHVPCLKATLSKTLGYGIIGGSVLVKVPQIMKIYAFQSAEGISIPGQILELYGVTASVAYSYVRRFPFSAWGDGIFMLAQTSAISGLSLYYKKGSASAVAFLTFYSTLLFFVMAGFVSIDLLWTFQATSVPVMFIGKVIQAYQNYTSKSMGQQSSLTAALLFFGSLARVFTSVQETGDFLIIIGYSLAALINGIMLTQFSIYPCELGLRRPTRGKKHSTYPQLPPKRKKQR